MYSRVFEKGRACCRCRCNATRLPAKSARLPLPRHQAGRNQYAPASPPGCHSSSSVPLSLPLLDPSPSPSSSPGSPCTYSPPTLQREGRVAQRAGGGEESTASNEFHCRGRMQKMNTSSFPCAVGRRHCRSGPPPPSSLAAADALLRQPATSTATGRCHADRAPLLACRRRRCPPPHLPPPRRCRRQELPGGRPPTQHAARQQPEVDPVPSRSAATHVRARRRCCRWPRPRPAPPPRPLAAAQSCGWACR